MKKVILGSLFFVFLFLLISSCNKTKLQKDDYANAVWITPNNKVIPYKYAENWKQYEKEHFTKEKLADKRYVSQKCTTESSKCGLECVQGKVIECDKESACAPCVNCPCTETKSPYLIGNDPNSRISSPALNRY